MWCDVGFINVVVIAVVVVVVVVTAIYTLTDFGVQGGDIFVAVIGEDCSLGHMRRSITCICIKSGEHISPINVASIMIRIYASVVI